MGLRELVRPLALRTRQLVRGGLRFDGDYRDWEEAQRASHGYGDEAIMRKMCEAELAVKRGEAADARDGVLFERMQFSFSVMAGLGRIAQTPLRVLDYGGAFGGSYRQYQAFYGKPVSWAVVEQPGMVSLGEAHFETADLHFHSSFDAALAAGAAHAVLLSSSLQYLRTPYDLIRAIVAARIAHIIIDRTPCSTQARDILAVQKVPPEIYAASYPCWIFSRSRLLEAFAPSYDLVASFSDASGTWRGQATDFELAGFILDAR